jgi:hypothetical protein
MNPRRHVQWFAMAGGDLDTTDDPTALARAAATGRFGLTFEHASAALAALPGMFLEPDGSFVWRSTDSADPWQLDGELYDRDGRLALVELRGAAPAAAWLEIARSLGDEPLRVFDVAAGCWLADDAWRRSLDR